jgi:hypothetical protein
VAQMERYYGQIGHRDAEAFWHGCLTIDYMAESYPLTSLAVDNALGVLVHSAQGWDDLKRKHPCPVVYAPLPYPASHRSPEMRPGCSATGNRRTSRARSILLRYLWPTLGP